MPAPFAIAAERLVGGVGFVVLGFQGELQVFASFPTMLEGLFQGDIPGVS